MIMDAIEIQALPLARSRRLVRAAHVHEVPG